jgi:hypothetical protein
LLLAAFLVRIAGGEQVGDREGVAVVSICCCIAVVVVDYEWEAVLSLVCWQLR